MLSKNELKTLLTFASGDEARYMISSVRLEKERAVATDGHRLVIIPCKGPDLSVTIQAASLKPVLKVMHAGDNMKYLGINPNTGQPEVGIDTPFTRSTFVVELIDGDYPDYKKVVPEGEPALTIGFDPKYIKEAMEVAIREKAKVRFSFRDDLSAATIECGDSDEEMVTMLVMPMRIG